ncbi:MAG: divergent polysaccharide deacetylase family protein, partial [Campylobacterota bacterium]|nr:divergent polysaccharide deacetylase family protein [Campylobacterota bacterium]
IIIDDVSFKRDVRRIKALDIPLTMSFLPPNKRHPDSAKLASKEPYYMVHIPLEAMSFNATESNTLYTKDSQQHIMKRINEIKRLFPKVKYINNHTGSKFTANEIAMNRLMFALRKKNMMFIDSRTTAETKVPRVMKNYGLPYIARDVFLDHVADVAEIKKQIKKAIAVAKRSGSAIAIGHPRTDTLQAIRESKHLFKGVELVGINDYL